MNDTQIAVIGKHVPVQGDEICPTVAGTPEVQVRPQVDGDRYCQQRDRRPAKMGPQPGSRVSRRALVRRAREMPELQRPPANDQYDKAGEGDTTPFRRDPKPNE